MPLTEQEKEVKWARIRKARVIRDKSQAYANAEENLLKLDAAQVEAQAVADMKTDLDKLFDIDTVPDPQPKVLEAPEQP